MGSKTDHEHMQHTCATLDALGVPYETRVVSAHRTPDWMFEYASGAEGRGLMVIIAAAGGAAHLAGVVAAHTDLPVIGIPMDNPPLGGLDALLATVQMPAGIPVATMAIGKAGAANAGIFAAQIIACKDSWVATKLAEFKKEMAAGVEDRDRKLQNAKRSA